MPCRDDWIELYEIIEEVIRIERKKTGSYMGTLPDIKDIAEQMLTEGDFQAFMRFCYSFGIAPEYKDRIYGEDFKETKCCSSCSERDQEK